MGCDLFTFNPIRNRVGMKPIAPTGNRVQILFSNRLAHLLGYREETEHDLEEEGETGSILYAPYPPNLSGHVNYVCVYLPILDGELVGGQGRLPLLRKVPFFDTTSTAIVGKEKDQQHHQINHIFTQPYYCKLSQTTLSHIHVVLKDQMGRPILFQDEGKVFLSCHLRPCSD